MKNMRAKIYNTPDQRIMAPLFMDGTGAALGGNVQRAVRGPSPREKAGAGPVRSFC